MKLSEKHEADLRNLAKEFGLPETNELGHSWSCKCDGCLDLETKRSGRVLKAFGLPSEKENGHALGCRCEVCRAISAAKDEEIRRKYQAREQPDTIGGLFMSELRKNKEH